MAKSLFAGSSPEVMKLGGGFMTAMMGGLAAEATGGEFSDGALTAMVVYLYNELSVRDLEYLRRRRAAIASAYEKAFGDKAHSYMMDDPKTAKVIFAAVGLGIDVATGKAEFEALGLLGKMTLSEAKSLIRRWGKGRFDNIAESLRYHANKHGNGDIAKYLRKAANFNFKRARSTGVRGDGSIKYVRPNGEFIIMRDGSIVSYGKNKLW